MSLPGKLLQALWVHLLLTSFVHLLLTLGTHGGEKYDKIETS